MIADLNIELADEETVLDAEYENETVSVEEYIISGYGADFDVFGLVRRLNQKDIEVPDFQRSYVWNRQKASRFIESLLMGLPVPGIFLYRELGSQKLQVIDGQQRLLSLQYYYRGCFPGIDQVFTLKGLGSRFDGFAYDDLPEESRRKLDDSIIHASIIHQLAPDDNGSSRYSIFERLNTSSTPLTPQEIRSAIFGGELDTLLADLNENDAWRKLFGKVSARMRDQELILRFLALYYDTDNYRSPMKSFLNNFMSRNRHLTILPKNEVRWRFEKTVESILDNIGERAFRPYSSQVNAAVADSIMVGVARAIEKDTLCSDLRSAYDNLSRNSAYAEAVASGTSQLANVRTRLNLATDAFANSQ